MNEKKNAVATEIENTIPQEVENTTPPPQIEVSVKLIEPLNNLLGFASVKFNNAFVVNDFKIFSGEKGLFVGMPSKPDKSSNSGYRDTAKPITGDFRKQLTEAVITAFYEAERQQDRAAASRKEKMSIPEQLAEGAKQAAKNNATLPDPAKNNKAHAAR